MNHQKFDLTGWRRNAALFLLVFAVVSFTPRASRAQGAVVPLGSPAYHLLERAENLGLLSTPLPTHRPLTRVEVASFLAQLKLVHGELTGVDFDRLLELEREFSLELTGKFAQGVETRSEWVRTRVVSFLPSLLYNNKEDFYSYSSKDAQVRFNPRLRADWGFSDHKEWDRQTRYGIGWSIQANWTEQLSMSFRWLDHFDRPRSTTAHSFRERESRGISDWLVTGEQPSMIVTNYAENTYDRQSEEYIVSNTSLVYQTGRMTFLLGRENLGWGPGVRQRLTVGSQVSPVDQIRFDIKLLESLRFVYVHGWLRAEPALQTTIVDTLDARVRKVDRPKYIAAHRIEWTPKHWATLGLAEAVVYGDRAPEPAYLTPVNLFFASEHNRGDLDNKSVALDLTLRPHHGATVYGGVWVDDLTTSKIGTSYIQNKCAYLSGVTLDDPFEIPDLRVISEYARTDPFAGTHFYSINRYDHWARPLGLDLPPDADQFTLRFEWQPALRWHIAAESILERHVATSMVDGNLLSPGDIENNYDGTLKTGLPWGSGQGEVAHDIGLEMRYEVLEHMWIAAGAQRKRIGEFNTQHDLVAAEGRTSLPGLFDWSKTIYPKEESFYSVSILFNLDR